MKVEQSIINFAAYEDAVEFLGMAKATMPDITMLTNTISGAGIAGNVEVVIVGHLDTMTLGLSFHSSTGSAMKLSEPRRHNVDLRIAQQVEDTVTGLISVQNIKHVLVVIPKSDKGGAIAPASPTDGSGEYTVRYWATYIDGKKVREIDPMNNVFYINGTDYLADVRKALGK